MIKRAWPCDPNCPLCGQEPETAAHLLSSLCFCTGSLVFVAGVVNLFSEETRGGGGRD